MRTDAEISLFSTASRPVENCSCTRARNRLFLPVHYSDCMNRTQWVNQGDHVNLVGMLSIYLLSMDASLRQSPKRKHHRNVKYLCTDSHEWIAGYSPNVLLRLTILIVILTPYSNPCRSTDKFSSN